MNNLNNLYPCLESIKTNTKEVTYETIVVCYLFSKDNLRKLKKDFPHVKIIKSDEIRGFSENNNLALRQAKGRHCFVLNDDTYFDTPVITELVNCLDKLPKDVIVVSPTVYNTNGSIQHCGRPKYNLFTIILYNLGLLRWYENHSKFTNKKGVFQTYNLFGAAFLIRTKEFESLGFFDESFFFCPEDIALSTKINKMGYRCFVKADSSLMHVGGGTWSKTIQATKPATEKGNLIFFGSGCFYKKMLYILISSSIHALRFLYWLIIKNDESSKRIVMMNANRNAIYAVFSNKTPKELFVKFFNKM